MLRSISVCSSTSGGLYLYSELTFPKNRHLPYTVGFSVPRHDNERPLHLNLSNGTSKPSSNAFDATAPVPNLLQTLGHSVLVTPPKTPPATLATPNTEDFFFNNQAQKHGDIAEEDTGIENSILRPRPNISAPPQTSVLTRPRRNTRRRSSVERGLLKNATWFIEPFDQGNGGLRNAVSAALGSGVIENRTWVGTLGMPTDGLDDSMKSEIESKLRDDYDSQVVYCKDDDFNGHYAHYCKEVSADQLPECRSSS